MKPVRKRLVVEWVLTSWSEISNETTANSMKSCGLALAIDDKKGKECELGKAMLENQLKFLMTAPCKMIYL